MKIAISATSFIKNSTLVEEVKNQFSQHEICFADPSVELSNNDLVNFLTDCQIAVVGKEKLTQQILERLPKLQAISKYGVGLDNLDQQALKTQDIKLYHTAGVNKDAVAELAIGLMLSVLRKISLGDRRIHHGEWVKDGGIALTGKIVAIIGCGNCGGALARVLKAFSCQLLLVDIKDASSLALATETGGTTTTFTEAIQKADVVSFHVPLTPTTKKMLSTKELESMKPSAVVINTSRGPVVDEEALTAALRNHTILGAGLDVFESEPVGNNDIISLDNFVGTPHIAGNSQEAVLAMGKAAIKGVKEFLLLNQ